MRAYSAPSFSMDRPWVSAHHTRSNSAAITAAASTMKVPVMIELFRQAHAGAISLADTLQIRNEFHSIVDGSTFALSEGDDSDSLIYAAIGKSLTLEQPRICSSRSWASANSARRSIDSGRQGCRCCAASRIRRRSTKG